MPVKKLTLAVMLLTMATSLSHATQYSFESSVSANVELHDNIFVTTLPHDAVYGLVVMPNARFVTEEANWKSYLNARLRSNNFNESGLDSNDLFFDVNASYQRELSVYSLSMLYNRDSSLNLESDEFGIAGRRVKSTKGSLSPQYRHVFSERASAYVSGSVTRVDYDDLTIGFLPYALETLSGGYTYNVSELSKLSVVVQSTDYRSDDDAFAYTLNVLQFGWDTSLQELWSVSASLGASRRTSTNRTTQVFDFFGQPITLLQTSESTSTGLVLDVNVVRKLERGNVSLRLARNESANSFGGLNEVSSVKLGHLVNLSEVWRLTTTARYEQVLSVGQAVRNTDRSTAVFELRTSYELDRHWQVSASYRYVSRKFDNVSNIDANSNRISFGMTYNFPDISTF